MGKREEVEVDALGDINLYQLGNNQLHKKIHERALRYPEWCFCTTPYSIILPGCLKRNEYIEEFVFNYGGWSALSRSVYGNGGAIGSRS